MDINFGGTTEIPINIGDGPLPLLSQNVRKLDLSSSLGINELMKNKRQNGEKVYHLGFGQSPFPVPNIMINELINNAHRKEYAPVKGIIELREAIANQVSKRYNIDRSIDDVIICPGSKECFYLLQTCFYGELILPSPSWVSYYPQSQILGRQSTWIHTNKNNDYKLDYYQLKELFEKDKYRPRILIINYPNNPTSVSMNDDELYNIGMLCRKHKVIVVSDEIYSELSFNNKHTSIVKYYPEGTIITTGVSKWAGAGGWRLGTMIIPPEMRWLMDSCAIIQSETTTTTSIPIQYGCIPAFKESNEMKTYLYQTNKILHALAIRSYNILKECNAHVVQPMGAFYIFPNFDEVEGIHKLKNHWSKRTGLDVSLYGGKELMIDILSNTGVGGLAGEYFGRPKNELSMKYCYVDFDGPKLMKNIGDLPDNIFSPEMDAFLEQYCPDTLNGFRTVRDFINSL